MLKKLSLIATSVIATLLLSEIAARFIIEPRSSGFGTGILSKKWFEEEVTYNGQGYRDSDFTLKMRENAVIMVGDSFTEGHGVKQNENFFAIAKARFHHKEFYNIGKNGENTFGQIKRLSDLLNEFSVEPTDVVFQYFFNDIEYLGPVVFKQSHWLQSPGFVSLSNHSVLFDYLYQPYLSGTASNEYSDNLFASFENESLFAKHLEDILKIYQLAKSSGATFHFLAFPNINNEKWLRDSRNSYIMKLEEFYMKHWSKGDSWIKISDIVLNVDSDLRRANKVDGHPSPEVHLQIGRILVDAIKGNENQYIHFHD
jgi:hypothetical protein